MSFIIFRIISPKKLSDGIPGIFPGAILILVQIICGSLTTDLRLICESYAG